MHDIKPYNTKQLSAIYGVTPHIMRKWLKKITDLGDQVGRVWTVKQVSKIFDHLGQP